MKMNTHIPKLLEHNEAKFTALCTYIKKFFFSERYHTSNLITYLRATEHKEVVTLKRSRLQEIMKLRVEINKIETKRTIQRINEKNSLIFKETTKIDKSLSKLTKRQRKNIQINKIRNKRRHKNRSRGIPENYKDIV